MPTILTRAQGLFRLAGRRAPIPRKLLHTASRRLTCNETVLFENAECRLEAVIWVDLDGRLLFRVSGWTLWTPEPLDVLVYEADGKPWARVTDTPVMCDTMAEAFQTATAGVHAWTRLPLTPAYMSQAIRVPDIFPRPGQTLPRYAFDALFNSYACSSVSTCSPIDVHFDEVGPAWSHAPEIHVPW